MSMTILKNHHTFDVFWIKRRAVKHANYTKIVCLRCQTVSSHCTASAFRVKGVGVQTARLRLSSWQWLSESPESKVLSTLTICHALPPRCFTIASFCVQMRQKAASCRSGCSASTSACSPRLKTAFASERQLARGRMISRSQPTSPSSLSSRAISSPLWLRLNHSDVSGENAGFPCSP